jgi:hypothetical protein
MTYTCFTILYFLLQCTKRKKIWQEYKFECPLRLIISLHIVYLYFVSCLNQPLNKTESCINLSKPESCINQTLNKTQSCINPTINKGPMYMFVGNLCWFNLYKLNTYFLLQCTKRKKIWQEYKFECPLRLIISLHIVYLYFVLIGDNSFIYTCTVSVWKMF